MTTTSSNPIWKRLLVQSKIPAGLEALDELAHNLWWSWNHDAMQLFADINPEEWDTSGHNPIALLDRIGYERYQELLADQAFRKRLDGIMEVFRAYMRESPSAKPSIAYFCMEYGIHSSLKLYSGGLGVLAGDYLKEASDSNINMVGVGLLYRYGYFRQALSPHGDQIAHYDAQRFSYLPLTPVRDEQGKWIKVDVQFPERKVYAKVWCAAVGRIKLYLLDADIDENLEGDRFITHQLYGGDRENRLKQELLLGMGGIKALRALQTSPDIYHLNEGHASFINIERLRYLMLEKKLDYASAVEVVRASSLFTTHTPVPAGHDTFQETLLRHYLNFYTESINLPWPEFVALGRINPQDSDEEFSMSHLSARLCQRMNGVSRIHGVVSQHMFSPLYRGFNPDELHIGYVTNSVHLPTWTAIRWKNLYDRHFGPNYITDQANTAFWENIYKVKDEEILEVRKAQKQELVNLLRIRLERKMKEKKEPPGKILTAIQSLDNHTLIFGFARRFATYKRATLIMHNLERLANIVSDPERPVLFLFAGKAHPADGAGQSFIRRIVEVSAQEPFVGKILFLEDYDMDITRAMIQGVDVWLNTPTRPLEASGTSGMKATMNGVLNFSVLDGWWAEGYRTGTGWALTEERTYEHQEFQNELDAETIYHLLETEVIPEYYEVNKKGIPEKWVQRIKKSIATLAPQFTMKRMLDDYFSRFYNKLHESSTRTHKNNYAEAKAIAKWKKLVEEAWPSIELVEISAHDSDNKPLSLGDHFKASITLDLGSLSADHIQVELVFARNQPDGSTDTMETSAMVKERVKSPKGRNFIRFSCDTQVTTSGVFDYGFRMYAYHPALPHPQDFNLVRWL